VHHPPCLNLDLDLVIASWIRWTPRWPIDQIAMTLMRKALGKLHHLFDNIENPPWESGMAIVLNLSRKPPDKFAYHHQWHDRPLWAWKLLCPLACRSIYERVPQFGYRTQQVIPNLPVELVMALVRCPSECSDASLLGRRLKSSSRTANSRFLKAATIDHLSTWDPNDFKKRGIPSKSLINVYKG